MNAKEIEYLGISYPFGQNDEARLTAAIERGKQGAQFTRKVHLPDASDRDFTAEQWKVIRGIVPLLNGQESLLCADLFSNGAMDVYIVDRRGLYCGVFLYRPRGLLAWPETVADAAQMVYQCNFADMTVEEIQEFGRYTLGRSISYDVPDIFVIRVSVDRYLFLRGRPGLAPVLAAVDLSAARLWLL